MTCQLVPDFCKPVHELVGYFHITREDALLFVARAFRQYIRDIEAELATGRNPDKTSGYPSALDDFTGQRSQLSRLCRLAGLKFAHVVELIEQEL